MRKLILKQLWNLKKGGSPLSSVPFIAGIWQQNVKINMLLRHTQH